MLGLSSQKNKESISDQLASIFKPDDSSKSKKGSVTERANQNVVVLDSNEEYKTIKKDSFDGLETHKSRPNPINVN